MQVTVTILACNMPLEAFYIPTKYDKTTSKVIEAHEILLSKVIPGDIKQNKGDIPCTQHPYQTYKKITIKYY